MFTRINLSVAALAACAASVAPARAATLTYVTGFAKTSDIFTNLNQQFPNTGAGVPGSRVGVANASDIYTPYAFSPSTDLAGNDGVSFDLASDSAGHDFAEFGSAGFGLPGSVTASVGVSGVTAVSALMSAYNGVGFTATFTGADGATESFNAGLPDFNGGGAVNSCAAVNGSATANLCVQTAFQVTDVGAGGSGNSSTGAYNTYDLVEVTFSLDSALAGEVLTSATFATGGYEGLLLGLTAQSPVAAPPPVTGVPEPRTLLLVGASLAGLGLARGRKGRRSLFGPA